MTTTQQTNIFYATKCKSLEVASNGFHYSGISTFHNLPQTINKLSNNHSQFEA